MVDIRQASLDEATSAPTRYGFFGVLGGPQFIIGQIFTIIATVLGVYLAGYVGFQRTLEYDRLNDAQRRTNLMQALHAELSDNTARLREFVPLMQKTQEGEGIYRGQCQRNLALSVRPQLRSVPICPATRSAISKPRPRLSVSR